jgi:DNA modification methylase
VWDSSRIEGVEVGKDAHPAAFPVGVAGLVLRVYSNSGDAALDPFSGTGTTLIACHHEQRIGYGLISSPAYVDLACRRYQEHTGTKPVLEATGEPHDFTAPDNAGSSKHG